MSHPTKQDMILAALKRPRGLIRPEAELLGDHVLPCTVNALRAKGHVIFGKWESVKNRFGGETQMMRYFHGGSV